MARRPFVITLVLALAALALTPVGAQATVEEGHPELYDNFVHITATHRGAEGFGPIKLVSPAMETEIECNAQFFGAAWNEGTPVQGHGEILGWTAQGDASNTGTELNRECKFKKGTAVVEAWVTDEPPLTQTGTLGKRGEPLTVPWNMEWRCGERAEETTAITLIGRPNGSAAVTGCKTESEEKNEIEAEESGRTGCYASPVPAGCMKMTVIQPSLGLETVYEGTMRPSYANGFGSGLNPSSLRFEGATSGRLRLATSFATTMSFTGSWRWSGYSNYELIQAK